MNENLEGGRVRGFADEWSRFPQDKLEAAELQALFDRYFELFPWDRLPAGAVGFDLGCGTGRWARGGIGHGANVTTEDRERFLEACGWTIARKFGELEALYALNRGLRAVGPDRERTPAAARGGLLRGTGLDLEGAIERARRGG